MMKNSTAINMMNTFVNDILTERVIGLAMKVHRILGPGFLESVYRGALTVELSNAGITVALGRRIAVSYAGVHVGDFIADMLVDDRIIVELKAVDTLHKAHELQTVHYLTATGLDIGLLINFGAERLQFKRKYRQQTASTGLT